MSIDRAGLSRASCTYDDIGHVMDLNRDYLLGRLDKDASRTIEMTQRIFETMRENGVGFCGGFGIGFPYHSLGKDGIVAQPEFDRYHRQVDAHIARAALRHPEWACGDCQTSGHFKPDQCGDCTLSSLKPRDIMKAAPDLDLFMVVDDVNRSTLGSIWQVAQRSGFNQSDHDTVGSLRRVQGVLESFSRGEQPTDFFPIDLHVIPKDDFMKMCTDMSSGDLVVSPAVWSMYASWKNNSDIDVWFDMVFSSRLFEDTADPSVAQAFKGAMSGLAAHHSTDFLIDQVANRSARASVLLQEPKAYTILKERIDAWRNLAT